MPDLSLVVQFIADHKGWIILIFAALIAWWALWVFGDEFLKSKGYRVLRFWNNDILNNIQGVMAAILQAILDKQIRQVPGEGK